jgi:hypothetical protein
MTDCLRRAVRFTTQWSEHDMSSILYNGRQFLALLHGRHGSVDTVALDGRYVSVLAFGV